MAVCCDRGWGEPSWPIDPAFVGNAQLRRVWAQRLEDITAQVQTFYEREWTRRPELNEFGRRTKTRLALEHTVLSVEAQS